MIKCVNCGREVVPTKQKMSILLFLILLFMWVIPAILYLIICLSRSQSTCPVCGLNVYKPPSIADKMMGIGILIWVGIFIYTIIAT